LSDLQSQLSLTEAEFLVSECLNCVQTDCDHGFSIEALIIEAVAAF